MRTIIASTMAALVLLTPGRAVAQGEPTQTALFVSGSNGYHTYRIPSLIVTTKGTLLAFCEARKKSAADHGDIDLVMRRSTDGGHTWSKMVVLADDGDHTMGNPCPVVDRQTGTILLPFCRDNKQVLLMKSADDGKSWSRPVEITRDVKKATWTWYATGPGIGIQLRSRRLVIPCDNHDASRKAQQSHVITSDDGGKTWQLGGVVGPKCDECQAVELADGRLMLNIRSYRGTHRRLVAISKDEGRTFSEPTEDRVLIEPVCQASLLRYPGKQGGLLFANPASTRREKLTVRLSRDEGRTWTHAKVLYPGPAAYSCLAVLRDGSIGCLYERGKKRPYETLTFARFSHAWLTGGKEASKSKPGLRFRQEERDRLARSPRQVAEQLAAVYGKKLDQVAYIPALALIGKLRLSELTHTPRYAKEVERIVAPFLRGEKSPVPRSGSEQAGHLIFAELALRSQGKARERWTLLCRNAADQIFGKDGKPLPLMPYHNEMSDAVFMAGPILALTGKLTGERKYFDAAVTHFASMRKLCLRRDGIYRHSPLCEAAWGRGNGFPALGLALALSHWPDDHPAKKDLIAEFQKHMAALKPYQDAKTGCWHQVIDHPESYDEYSCTCMIGFAMQRGIRRGWLARDMYQPCVERAWRAVKERTGADGKLVNVCAGTGKQKTLRAYLNRPAINGRDNRGGAMGLLFATELLAAE